ncbi:SDR family oxidoreductase [Streptomyces sp. NBC_01264]|uniref:SDR family oxidoreductase n=1 Tax=Streptomyces sp. NBC_01264 TaxID=2903804 RepID=UPI00225AB174|nr:hypothetical protein [Streptomyces sp. NBC_01264]MCX4781636.1 hypothetical protein [Streptomyces sp. NBC_01264]
MDPALIGDAETVLHLTGGPKGDDAATARLVRAARTARAAGTVKHLILVWVFGADAMPLGYFRAKAGAERAVMESGIGWTVLPAAQVNELLLKMVGAMRRMPLVPAPGGLRVQPVDAAEAAAQLAELTLGAPAGRVPDLAGPGVYTLPELAAAQRVAAGAKPRRTLPVRLPGKVGRAYRRAPTSPATTPGSSAVTGKGSSPRDRCIQRQQRYSGSRKRSACHSRRRLVDEAFRALPFDYCCTFGNATSAAGPRALRRPRGRGRLGVDDRARAEARIGEAADLLGRGGWAATRRGVINNLLQRGLPALALAALLPLTGLARGRIPARRTPLVPPPAPRPRAAGAAGSVRCRRLDPGRR